MRATRGVSLLAKTCITSGALLLCLKASAFWHSEPEPPTRAHDSAYGMVLYDFYQGHAFDALTRLYVAKERGGIRGHGDHPGLVEGGLLLSYGMTREAKAIFESVLNDKLSPEERNLAWFYLGKVFYLEQNLKDAQSSFAKVDLASFEKQAPEAYYELVYLRSQSQHASSQTVKTSLKGLLPETHIYHYYLSYNQAIEAMDGKDNSRSKQLLYALADALTKHNAESGGWFLSLEEKVQENKLAQERQELKNQALLSLGQLYLNSQQFQLAAEVLQQVEQTSAFSDQALFAYAIAASQLTRFPDALAALNTLNSRTLMNPWQQQTPYALAFLYEQMQEPVLALESYRAAVGRYEQIQVQLKSEQQTLSVAAILDALAIENSLGTDQLSNDAYGRVELKPYRFSFAKLLASEAFQRQVSELHELYALRNAFKEWAQKIASADDLLATRLQSRQEKIQVLQSQLASLDVAGWSLQQQHFAEQIERASATENARFFMNPEQIDYAQRLQKAKQRLQTLPIDHPKYADYAQRYQRAQAYFNWWIEEDYPVNRWTAQKQLNGLNRQMTIFNNQYQVLNQQQDMDAVHQNFEQRLAAVQARLNVLEVQLQQSIEQSGNKLIKLVDQAMQAQLVDISRYLLASREALARISDQLLEAGSLRYQPAQEPKIEEGTP